MSILAAVTACNDDRKDPTTPFVTATTERSESIQPSQGRATSTSRANIPIPSSTIAPNIPSSPSKTLTPRPPRSPQLPLKLSPSVQVESTAPRYTSTTTPSPLSSVELPTTTASPNEDGEHAIWVGDTRFKAELAISPDEKSLGLGFRDNLPQDTGMIFLYHDPATYSFWMRGMEFPLDFLWIGPACTIVDISQNVGEPASNTPTYQLDLVTPTAPALHVLEINAGLSATLGIKIDQPVRLIGRQFKGFGCHERTSSTGMP